MKHAWQHPENEVRRNNGVNLKTQWQVTCPFFRHGKYFKIQKKFHVKGIILLNHLLNINKVSLFTLLFGYLKKMSSALFITYFVFLGCAKKHKQKTVNK